MFNDCRCSLLDTIWNHTSTDDLWILNTSYGALIEYYIRIILANTTQKYYSIYQPIIWAWNKCKIWIWIDLIYCFISRFYGMQYFQNSNLHNRAISSLHFCNSIPLHSNWKKGIGNKRQTFSMYEKKCSLLVNLNC